MVELKFKTKDYSTPQGKQNVYFCCHPEDFDLYFKSICSDIFQFQDCAIWYKGDPAEKWETAEMEAQLGLMQMFVVPVTSKFLEQENEAREIEFSFAVERHIPILPLIQEEGLETKFNRICGEWQCLDKNANNRDKTAISYNQKLSRYLSTALLSDEDEKKVRNAFSAYIFMSYRKKDRRDARELMGIIHQYNLFRDVAIWYDEFLIPGENYNQTIEAALNKSAMVAFVITPSVLEPGNYIMAAEYPDAIKAGKPILPVEMEKTDEKELRHNYENIPELISPYDKETFLNILIEGLQNPDIQENDDPDHLYCIGLAYLYGIDAEIDYGRAIQLISRAAEQGNLDAQNKLGDCYFNGKGVSQNYEEAVKWYRKAAEQGDMSAQYNLGACYHFGQGVAQDYEMAVQWYMLSAEQGLPASQNNIGVCYEKGLGVSQDDGQAAQWYLKAAEQGYAMAQSNLGTLYLDGRGVPKDDKEAVEWYIKSADQGYANAQYNLGHCYYHGYGVEQDYAIAAKWLEKAAEQNIPQAENDLGCCYSNGYGVGQDFATAVALFRMAAEQGVPESQCSLGDCYYYGYEVEQDYNQAFIWYKKAAEQGDVLAQNHLGNCYYGGFGTDQDYVKANEWYQKAADQGYALAQNSLGDSYQYGYGVEQDYEKAAEWYEKAKSQQDDQSRQK